uniref:7TM_GPCR_Srx domain-containing protein n=1 Tax=Steinernema glaseri TaxID=37863 RepID=A0A1I8A5J9_9BILA
MMHCLITCATGCFKELFETCLMQQIINKRGGHDGKLTQSTITLFPDIVNMMLLNLLCVVRHFLFANDTNYTFESPLYYNGFSIALASAVPFPSIT